MKTNREMTDSILQRASQMAQQQKITRKRAAGIMAIALCIVLLAGVFLTPWTSADIPLSTEGQLAVLPTTQAAASNQVTELVPIEGLYFLSAKEDGAVLKQIQPDMTYAVDHVIRVFSLKSLPWPEGLIEGAQLSDKDKAWNEASRKAAKEFYNNWKEKYEEIADENSCYKYESNKAIIYSLSAGFASVILPDYTQIVKVVQESTGVLQCDNNYALSYKDHTFKNGENVVTIPKGSYRVYLSCWPSNDTIRLLEDRPDMSLSSIKDTFTLTIYYKNGTKAKVILDVTLDDDGQIYMTMRGTNSV